MSRRTAAPSAREILADETPPSPRRAGYHLGLLYPGSYPEAAASLGMHFLVESLRSRPGFSAARLLAPAGDEAPLTLEHEDDPRTLPVILCSVSWELQLKTLVEMLRRSRIPPLRRKRDESFPLIVAGGPLTISNPALLEPVADVVIRGDGEPAMEVLLHSLATDPGRQCVIDALEKAPGAAMGGFAVHGDAGPAHSAFITPRSVFADMHLVEVMRGCPHGCHFCVMSHGRLRRRPHYFPVHEIVETIPAHARRVGLVGPSVLEHPEIDAILATLLNRGLTVGISSARADRVDRERASTLARLGLQTLTVALDGPSARIRRAIRKNLRARDLLNAARNARASGIGRLKLYCMTGFPDEGDEDIEELVDICRQIGAITRLTVSMGPLVPKTSTPLEDAHFVARNVYERRVKTIRRSLRQAARVDSVSWREARMEARLARMDAADVDAVIDSHDMTRPFELLPALA